LGTFVGGQVLQNTPDSSGGQLHNYITIISMSLSLQFIALILLLVLVNEKPDQPNSDEDRQTLVDNEELDTNSNKNTAPEVVIQPETSPSEVSPKW